MNFAVPLETPTYRILAIGILSLIVLSWTISRVGSSLRRLPYPPGPPEKSIIAGNMSDLPSSFAWLTYIEWGKKYGAFNSA